MYGKAPKKTKAAFKFGIFVAEIETGFCSKNMQ